MNKPIQPTTHGIIDYVFSGVLAVPALLKMNRKAVITYGSLAAAFTLLNAFTDTPAGVKRRISLQTHKKADAGSLAGLALMSFLPFIRKEKKALIFHLAILGTAIANYLLTDYEAGTNAV